MYTKGLKLLSVAVICFLILSGCGKNTATKPAADTERKTSAAVEEKTAQNKKDMTIVTSFYPMYIHTINIARDIPGVTVINMTKPQTGCLHDYPLTPDDLKTLETAQVFVVNGAGMEAFMDKVTKQMPDLKIIEACKGPAPVNVEEENPHVWVSISNAIQQVKNISEQLSTADPGNAEKYRSNADAYVKKLGEQRDRMHKVLDGLKNRDIITFHEAFPYFAKEFNLHIASVIEREPGTEPSAQELAETIEMVKKSNIKALFAEPQYSAKAAETIAKETGAKVYTLDPAVTGEASGDYDAYLKIMDNNLKTLQEALQ